MRTTALYIVFTLLYIPAWAQVDVFNKGVETTVSNVGIHLNGNYLNLTDSLTHTKSGEINSNDTVFLSGDLWNMAPNHVFGSQGTVVFNGGSTQNIKGDSAIHFYRIGIQKTSGNVILQQSVPVGDKLLFGQGHLDLNGFNVELGLTGFLENENTFGRIINPNGFVRARRFLSSPVASTNIAGLGLHIGSSGNFSFTNIERAQDQQTGAGDGSIYRYWDFDPENSGIPVNIIELKYFNQDLNGIPESQLSYWQSNTGGTVWENKGGSADTVANLLSASTDLKLGNSILSLSDRDCATPPVVSLPDTSHLCQGDSIVLNAGNPGHFYLWSTGDITQSIWVGTTGTYFVTVTSVYGCESTDTSYVQLENLPTAAFSSTFACLGDTNFFTDASTLSGGGDLSLHWDFGDPSIASDTSSQADPYFVYSAAGTYSVKLTAVSGYGCMDSVSHNTFAHALPTVGFHFEATCEDSVVQFSDSTAISAPYAIMSRSWGFGDGSVSSNQHPVHTYGTHGTYEVKQIAVSNAGCVDSASLDITVYPNPVADFSISGACEGSPVAIVNNSGIANGSIGHSWNFGDGTASTQAAPSKTYAADSVYQVILEVSSGFGCFDSDTQSVAVHDMPTAQYSVSNACLGDTVFFTNASPANGALSYQWTLGDGSTSTSENPFHTYAADGSYSTRLKVTTAFGCADSTGQTVQVYPMPTASFSVGDECLGDAHSFSNASAITTGMLSYDWDFGDGTGSSQLSPLKTFASSGIHTVKLTASSLQGCADSTEMLVETFALPTVELGGNVSTCGSSMLLDAGNTGASYAWNTLANTQTIHVVSSGNYAVTVTDANGCIARDTATVTLNALPSLDLGPDLSACGNHTLNAFAPSATYAWSTGATTASIDVVATGQYWVEVTDQNNCVSSDTIYITILPFPLVEIGAGDTICAGETTVLDAQNPGASFAWSNGSTARQVSVGATGNYSVTVTENGCPSADTAFVLVNPVPSIDLGPDSASCVSHELSAGPQTNSYLWNTGETSATISVNSTGTYAVTAANEFQCQASDSVLISIYDLPILSLGNDTSFCEGAIFLVEPEVSETVNYSWGNGANSPILTVSGSGFYHLTVTNAYGCAASDSIILNTHPLPMVDFSFNAACADSLVAFSDSSEIAAPYTIASRTWTFGDGSSSTSQNPVHAYASHGTFEVWQMAVSNAGCVDSASQSITVHPNPVANFTAADACEGSEIVFTNNSSIASGNIGHDWDFGDGTNSVQAVPLKAYATDAVYQVVLQVSSAFGCVDRDTQTVQVNDVPVAGFTLANTCQSDTALFINATSLNNATATYNWTFGDGNGSTAEEPAHSYAVNGNYTVTLVATSEYGCADTASQAMQVFPLPSASFSANDACLGDATTFLNTSSISAGTLGHAWDFGDGTYSTVPSPSKTYASSGIYTVKLLTTSSHGCMDSTEAVVEVFAPPVVDLGNNLVTCGSTMVLDAGNPGATYNWSTFETTQHITAQANGNYAVTVTDGNGCSVSDTASVTLNTLPAINLGPDFSACGSSLLDAFSPLATYQWSTGETTASIEIAASGQYWVEVTDQNNCIASDTVQATIFPFPVVEIGAGDTICAGDSVILDAQNTGSDFAWSNGTGSQQTVVHNTGSYAVTVTENGCSASDTAFVQVNPVPAVFLGNDSAYCASHTLVAGDATNEYLWNTGDTTASLSVVNSGTFAVTATNAFGCTASDSVSIAIHALPVLSLGNDTALCQGTPFIIEPEVSEPVIFSWANGNADSSQTVSTSGFYKLTVTNAEGCSVSDTIEVLFHALPTFDLGGTVLLLNGDSAHLGTGNTQWSHVWTVDTGILSTEPVFTTADSGMYTVTVTDSNGCSAVDSVFVNALDQFLLARFLCVSEAHVGDTVQFVQLSFPDPLQYYWSFGDGGTSTDSNATHIYFLEDTFKVTLVAYNDLYADTMVKYIAIVPQSSNAKEIVQPEIDPYEPVIKSVNLYPNPTADGLNCEIELYRQAPAHIDFYSIQGFHVFTDDFYGSSYQTRYPFERLTPGVYFMRVTIGFETKTFKFIKI